MHNCFPNLISLTTASLQNPAAKKSQQQNPAAPHKNSTPTKPTRQHITKDNKTAQQHITKARTDEIEGTHTCFPRDFHKLTHRTAERSLRPSRLSRREEARRDEANETRRTIHDSTTPRTNERTAESVVGSLDSTAVAISYVSASSR